MNNHWLLGKDKNRGRNTYIWNSLCGFLNALQATIILFVLQRVADENVSGVFSIGFATANMMLAIGKYGVRYHQVSDLQNEYSYSGYFAHRILTGTAMAIASLLFCAVSFFFGSYSPDKALFCLLLCLQKVVDAIEDVIHGEYQKKNYLDAAGRAMTLRLLCTILSFLGSFVLTHSLVAAAGISLIVSVLALLLTVWVLRRNFETPHLAGTAKEVRGITWVCLPLFATSFLSLFIVNAPKYAIDSCLSAEAQAIYSFVSMPVLVIALLAECVFRPMITSFSETWYRGELSAFVKRILKVCLGILALTVICVIGGVIVGIPVLSYFFATELKSYWVSVAILLIGGGFLSLVSFLNVILTIIKQNRSIAWSHLAAAAVAMPISLWLVKRFDLLGAAFAYLAVIFLLCASVVAFLSYYIVKEKSKKQ